MALHTVSHDLVPFSMIADTRRGQLTMSLHGELDFACSEMLDDVSYEGDDDIDSVVVDLAELDFTDTAGIRALVGVQRRNRERGRDVTLTDATGLVRRVFSLYGREDALLPAG